MRLKLDQDLDDGEINMIDKLFQEQKIKFKQLVAKKGSAITDEKLKEMGVSQMGLRIAIQEVIESFKSE